MRGKRDFRLTWQSRGSALVNKVLICALLHCFLGNAPPFHYPDRPPLTVTELKFEISDMRLHEIDFVDRLFQPSLRGKRDFRLTWQSRGSALANKVAFQRIATLRQNQSRLAMTCFIRGNKKVLSANM